MLKKINYSIKKFDLNLTDKVILTEAATGSYSCTPIICLLAGAKKVYALAKETSYGNYDDIEKTFFEYKNNPNLKLINSLDEIIEHIDIITNSGFVRPIDERYLKIINSNSVITLMYEPWEFRESDLNLKLLHEHNIKVYGTNEHDKRLQTMDYIGLTVLYHLLNYKITHFSNCKILLLGNYEFTEPIERILISNNYSTLTINNYNDSIDPTIFDVIVVAENKNNQSIIGNKFSYIDANSLTEKQKIIHICGNVDFKGIKCTYQPEKPANFGYMSYRTDFIDDMALIDLQTASLKVAEGMLKANQKSLKADKYKEYMEKNYPALSFEDKLYW